MKVFGACIEIKGERKVTRVPFTGKVTGLMEVTGQLLGPEEKKKT